MAHNNRQPNSINDQITHQNILKQCTICNEPISRPGGTNNHESAIAASSGADGADQNVMCSDCIEYFTKSPPHHDR